MVERVEGYCSEAAWRRAYREINGFERELADHGMILAKFWIHISAEEQLERFRARRDTAYKTWKLTDEDWRNRSKWNAYEQAVQDMLLRTSTLTAPWTIVEGNDKRYARVKTLSTLVALLSHELNHQPREPAAATGKGGDVVAKKDKGKKSKGKKKSKKKGKK
jgi:polyphosphate kinase 2 (PPK2 family)